VVGNTVVDALLYTRDRVASGYRLIEPALAALPTDKKLVLATTHRRENIGDPIRYVLRALRTLGEDGDKLVGLPVDLNPDVRKRPARRLSRLCTQRSSACEAPLRSSTCSRARNLLIGARERARCIWGPTRSRSRPSPTALPTSRTATGSS
jgi:UDP-N-acetylglucosamine 2-epimerase